PTGVEGKKNRHAHPCQARNASSFLPFVIATLLVLSNYCDALLDLSRITERLHRSWNGFCDLDRRLLCLSSFGTSNYSAICLESVIFMRILVHLVLAASAAVAFNQSPQDSSVKLTTEQAPVYRALQDHRILEGEASAASPNTRRLTKRNWLTSCFK
ncbi:unnamed protein product, partial [Aphanomyces euteiches]